MDVKSDPVEIIRRLFDRLGDPVIGVDCYDYGKGVFEQDHIAVLLRCDQRMIGPKLILKSLFAQLYPEVTRSTVYITTVVDKVQHETQEFEDTYPRCRITADMVRQVAIERGVKFFHYFPRTEEDETSTIP